MTYISFLIGQKNVLHQYVARVSVSGVAKVIIILPKACELICVSFARKTYSIRRIEAF